MQVKLDSSEAEKGNLRAKLNELESDVRSLGSRHSVRELDRENEGSTRLTFTSKFD